MLQQATRFLGVGRYFWDALREINPNDIRTELQRPVRIGLFGRPNSGRHTLARGVLGYEDSMSPARGITINELDSAAVAASGSLDLALVVLDAMEPDWSPERRVVSQLGAYGYPAVLVVTHADQLPMPDQALPALRAQFPAHPPEMMAVVDARDADATTARLLRPILQALPNCRLGLAHQYPKLRGAVAEDLIRETSRVNAQLALVASLPTLIPVLGFFVGGIADILVLTKNQAMLVFKLAGIFGRDIDDRMGILREIAPVVGSAFVWRTMARTAVGLAPAPISALPKAAVAYAGTYVVGQAARYYYERGNGPPPEAIQAFRREARRLYSSLNEALKQKLTFGPREPAA